ncbi:hypothetical protein NIES2101_19125 [Calothrix sp. HK-06]|nr:hypothetical protein NIES2101_19125 [Calothrix sp. HK-06]
MIGSTSTFQLATLEQAPSVIQPNIISSNVSNSTIIEAQGWVKDTDSSVMVVAVAPDVTLNSNLNTSACPVVK